MGKRFTGEEINALKRIFTDEEIELIRNALYIYSQTKSFITHNLSMLGEELGHSEELAKSRELERRTLNELEKKIQELL